MLIYISANVQYSVFSGGSNMTSLQLALGFKELGHEVALLNIVDNGLQWFEDCSALREEIPVVQKTAFSGLIPSGRRADLLIDVLGCITGTDRQRIADKNVLFLRHPMIINEIESCIYPGLVMKRFYDNINEVWTYDFYTRNDYIVLKMLAQCPIKTLPFFWSSKIANVFCQEAKISPWFWVKQSAGSSVEGLKVRIAENNSNVRSNCILPLVICRQFDKDYPEILKEIRISNGQTIKERAFFKDNILKHIDTAVTPVFEGRSRAIEWSMSPNTIVLCHNRFITTRFMHFDLAWMGIPIIHNSVFLKQLGAELTDFYYENNSVTGAAAAMKRCYDTIQRNTYFNETSLQRTRYVISNGLSIRREKVIDIWSNALTGVGNDIAPVYEIKPAAILPPLPSESKTDIKYTEGKSDISDANIYRMQFIGMWDQFQPTYNFFTLLMEKYLAEKAPHLKVIGCGSEYMGTDIQIRILGPFGCKDPVAGNIPTVFFTGENIDPLNDLECEKNNIKLQLGFNPNGTTASSEYIRLPLWMLYIDWFGADNDKLVNPKVISLDKCIKSHERPIEERQNFCAFIVSNPNNPIRNEAFEQISKIGHVTSAGRHLNNYGDSLFAGLGGGGGELRKVNFLENFRFNITYENGYGLGYVTEKLFHAKVAGAIPIYWGDSEWVSRDFNSLGFIDARGLKHEELLGRLQFLESPAGHEERDRMAKIPLFSESKAGEIRSHLMNIAATINRISDIKTSQTVSSRNNVTGSATATTIYGRSY